MIQGYCTYVLSVLEGEPAWPSGKVLRWQAEGPRFDSPLQLAFLFKKLLFMDTLVTLLCTLNKTLKWLTSLPISMRKSFWL